MYQKCPAESSEIAIVYVGTGVHNMCTYIKLNHNLWQLEIVRVSTLITLLV